MNKAYLIVSIVPVVETRVSRTSLQDGYTTFSEDAVKLKLAGIDIYSEEHPTRCGELTDAVVMSMEGENYQEAHDKLMAWLSDWKPWIYKIIVDKEHSSCGLGECFVTGNGKCPK